MTFSQHLRFLTFVGALLFPSPARAQEGKKKSFWIEEHNLLTPDGDLQLSAKGMVVDYFNNPGGPPVGLFGHFNYQLSEKYLTPYAGLAFWPIPLLQCGVGVGPGNTGGFVWLGWQRFFFYASASLKPLINGWYALIPKLTIKSFWYEGHLTYQVDEMVSFGLTVQRFSGVGPRIDFKGLVTNLTLSLIIPSYDWERGQVGSLVALRFDL